MKRKKIIPVLSAMLAIAINSSADTPPYMNPELPVDLRVEDLIGRMTLEEKVSQMMDNSPGIDRLGVKPYVWWNECLHGVARAGKATVFPQAIGMAAMWDRPLMYEIATAISDEARAKYHDFNRRDKHGIYQGLTYWTPNINIFRDPRWGRGMETYGEDPYLTGELGVQFVKGLQGDDPMHPKLIATAKHFSVHSGPESSRHSFDARPTERDFKATYTPHFKKVVQEGGVKSVMCAYNRYMGMPCCGSHFLNNLLRNEWGFDGYIVSDCGAVLDFYNKGAHEVTATREEAAALAVEAGTDLNCGGTYGALVNAVNEGLLLEEEIDTAVKRLMKARFELGMFDPDSLSRWSSIPLSIVESEKHKTLARKAAEKSMVLLKNEGNMLPLKKDLKKIAVIGPNADELEVLLANYNGYPTSPVTALTGIREKMPEAEVVYEPGCPIAEGLPLFTSIPSGMLYTDNTCSTPGLTGTYYSGSEPEGQPFAVRVDPNIDFVWGADDPMPGLGYERFSVSWEGVLVVPQSGIYALGTEAFSGSDLWLDGKKIVSRYDKHNPRKEYEYVELTAGLPYPIRMDYRQRETEYAMARLLWQAPDPDMKERAVKAAEEADAVVLCMGISPLLEGEEMKVKVPGFSEGDREDINIPAVQTELMKEIMALGKPTVLVLFNGSALAFNWENEHIPAIIEAWYPGQEGGTALANVLFGDANPSGKLPLTFYKSIDQIPAFDDYDMEGKTYRYFLEEPLYPFGHGLSYTDFNYRITELPAVYKAGETLLLTAEVENTGQREGEAVVEVYISTTGIPDQPVRQLSGFDRISLKPGESGTVKFEISPEQMMVLDESNNWIYPYGELYISVGGCQPSSKYMKANEVSERFIRVE